MPRCNKFLGLAIVATVCLLLIAFNEKNAPRDLFEDPEGSLPQSNRSISIEEVVQMEHHSVRLSLWDYPFPERKQLENYTMATGGRPVRTIIVATWRSGSTFLGAVLNDLPGNYYHYEPLLDHGMMQIRGPPYAESAVGILKKLLKCDYSTLGNYLEYGKKDTYLFKHNTRLWSLCESFPQFCWNSSFLSKVCKVFPFQSMKTVRMRLRLVEEVLRDQELNVKVLLLIRDPRGVMQSRKHKDWCSGAPDCDKPNLVCADMVADYSAAIQLTKLYPERFRAMRYEDLCMDPYTNTKDLFRFFGLHFHRAVKEFLDTHTKHDARGLSSTTRDTKNVPFHWRTKLNFSEVHFIEENCDQAMKRWGYLKASNQSHLKEFYPLTNYTIQ